MTDTDPFPSELPTNCGRCGEGFANSSNLHRHLRSAHQLFDIEEPLRDDSYIPLEVKPVPTAEERVALDSLEEMINKLVAEFSIDPVERIFPTIPAARGGPGMTKDQLALQLAGRDPSGALRSHAQRIALDRLGGYVAGPVTNWYRRKGTFDTADFTHRSLHRIEVAIGGHEASVREHKDPSSTIHKNAHAALGIAEPPGRDWGIGHEHQAGGVVVWKAPAAIPKHGEARLQEQIDELRAALAKVVPQ